MKKAGNTWIPDNDDYFASYFAASDVFEQKNLDIALSFVKKFDLAVDCGAHVGSWSRYMGRRFHTVVAYEPNPENYECLLKNCPQVFIKKYNVGLSDKPEKGSLAGGNNTGCWHVVEGDDVELIRLPDFGALDFIKIDVEGYEKKVLMGAEMQLIKYRPVVLIEEKALPHKPLNYDARHYLESLGFVELARSGRDVIFGY